MAETITLTVPPNTFKVVRLILDLEGPEIMITLAEPGGVRINHRITGPAALSLMQALNKANLSSNSLHKRIISKLITDGVLAGTFAGSPD